MNTTTHFKITIPKPCHEDWNKFTPDEKGAFCKVCSKSVHDFTKKTAEEIKTVLVEEMSAGNKVCGRLNEDQLSDAPALKGDMQDGNSSFSNDEQLDAYSLNFQRIKKFAFALFLVFGGFLFNSAKTSAQKMGKIAYREPVRGEIAVYEAPKLAKDSVVAVPKVLKCGLQMKGDVKVEPIERPMVMGGAIAMPIVGEDSFGEEPIQPKGQVAIVEEPIETLGEVVAISIDEPIMGDTAVIKEDLEIMGLMVAEPYDVEPPVLIDPIPSDSIQNILDGEFAAEESTYVEVPLPDLKGGEEVQIPIDAIDPSAPKIEIYPNPSSTGRIYIKYCVKENSLSGILIYDMNGSLVKTLLAPQNLYAADYQSQFDLSDLRDGIYFCELTSGNQKTTSKIVISK